MPLKLVPPRAGKTPNFAIRGTYYGERVNRTAGTPDRAKARKALEKIKSDIECGAFVPSGGMTFAGAALSYVRSGKESTYIKKLADHFGMTKVSAIDQAAIDEAASMLYPRASAATRNRQVYTPISAILRHSKAGFPIRRPTGAQGKVNTVWLWEEDAFRLFDEAEKIDPELRTLLVLLCYTGLRLSEAIWLRVDNVRLSESFAFVAKTKNDDPRPLHLPPVLVAELANHPRGMDRPGETVCRFRKNGHLYKIFAQAKAAAKVEHVTFHTLRHTWATWMRRHAKLDTKGLMATGAWKDAKSAARYAHVVVTEEAQRSDMLPAPKRGKSVDNG